MKNAALGTAGITLGGLVYPAGTFAGSRKANEVVNFGIVGVNGRGKALLKAAMACSQTRVGYICDVDSRAMERAIKMVTELGSKKPKGIRDFRKLIEQKDLDAIRRGTKQNAPIHEGVITNNLCHLANIAQEVGRDLLIDPSTGKIINDQEAMKWWGREYEKGWEPKV